MVEEYKRIVKSFRVHELTILLDYVGSSRAGRKIDLIRRVLKLLDNQDNQLLIAKIDELQKIFLAQTRGSGKQANDENDSVTKESSQTQNKSNLSKKETSLNKNKMPTTRSMANGVQSNAQQPSTRQQTYDYGILRQNQPIAYYNNGAYSSYGQHQNMPVPPVGQHTTSRSGSGNTPYLTVVNAVSNTDQQVPSKSFEFKSLPFYDILGVLVPPQILLNRTSSKNQEVTSVFHISSDQYNQIMDGRVQKPPSGRFEFSRQVQIRFCKIDNNVGQQDDCFPPGIVVKVNTKMAALPNPMPTNKTGVEPKRPPRPVDITQLIKLQPNSANVVTINWNCDYPNNYGFTVNLVLKLNSNDLFNRLKSKGFSPNDVTLSLIREKLRPDDEDDIATESLRVSVTCPLGKMRITTPCRASTCTHIQCFDAMLFLLMNEKKPTWICPICDQKLLYSKLIIDGYFVDVLTSKNLSSDVVDIELSENSWRPITKGPAPTSSSVSSGQPSASSSSSKQKPTEKMNLNNSVDIIEVSAKKRPDKPASSSTYVPTPVNQIPLLVPPPNILQPRQQSQTLRQPIHQAPAPAPVPAPISAPSPAPSSSPTNVTAIKLPNVNAIATTGSNLYLAQNSNQNANKRGNESVVDLVSDSDEEEAEKYVPTPKRKAPLASLVYSKIQDSIREFNMNCNRNGRCSTPTNGSPPVITVDSSPSPSNSPVRRNRHETINTYIDFQMGYDDD